MFDLLSNYRSRRGVTATPGVTVTRIRGQLLVRDTAASGQTDKSYWLGIRTCQTDEVAAGNGPLSEQHADWMYFERVFPWRLGAATAGVDIDVKSSRKVEELEQTLCLFIEQASAEPADLEVTGTVSSLLLLP